METSSEKSKDSERTLTVKHTIERIESEANRKILNTILLNKLSKRSSKRYDEKCFTDRGTALQEDTMNKFQSLKQNLGPIPAEKLIDYESLYNKLKDEDCAPQYQFNFSDFLRKKQDEISKTRVISKECQLINTYQQVLQDIRGKKQLLRKIHIENQNFAEQIKNNTLEVIFILL